MTDNRAQDAGQGGATSMYRAVLAAADELMVCADLDRLFRRAVELAREQLGVERCAIFVEEEGCARGTYGTDMQGLTTDERDFRRPLEEHYGQQLTPPPPEGPSWFVVDHPWKEWDDGSYREVGDGWTVLTPIRYTGRPIGVFYNDAAITRSALDPELQDAIAVYCSILGNIIERMASEGALRKREQYLACLTEISAELLAASDLDTTLRSVLKRLQEVSGAGRCYLFENHLDPSDGLLTSLRFDACAEGLSLRHDDPNTQNLRWFQQGLARWKSELSAGRAVCGRVAELTEDERGVLEPWGSRSVAALPLSVSGEWYGFIGFSSYDSDHTWSAQEVGLLSGAASAISSTIERLAAEEALRRSERRARATTDAAMDAIVMLDGQGKVAYCNRAAEMMFGYSAEEALGMSPISLLASPEVRDLYEKEMRRLQQSGKSDLLGQSVGLTAVRRDGTEIPIEYSAASIPIGNEWHCVVILRDVTRRKQVEAALRRERDFVSAIVDTAGVLVVVLDREGSIVRFNRACEEVTGYRFDEVSGRKPWDFLIPPEEIEAAQALFASTPASGSPAKGETHWVAKDGSRRLVVWTNTCLRDAEGQVDHVIATGIDVTEHRRTEEAYRALVQQSLQGLLILQDDRIVFANPALCEISGYSEEELKALSPEQVRDMIHPDDQEEVWARIRDRFAGAPLAARNEFRGVRKDGSIRWVEAHASMITYGGRPALQVAYVDVTERSRAEREREALVRLTTRLAAAASVEDMAAVVREESEYVLGWDAHYFAARGPDADGLRVISLADTVEGTKVVLPTEYLPPASLSPAVESVLNGEQILINRTPDDPGPHLSGFGDTERPSASLIYVPVRSGRSAIGILSVQSYTPAQYSKADVQVMQRFADTVAPALERAHAEQMRAESERKYRELVENANSIILRVDVEGRVTFFNEFAQQFFGYREHEILGRSVVETLVPEGADAKTALGALVPEIFADPEKYGTLELENRTKDGRRVWVAWTNKPVFNVNAEPVGVLHVGNDITERKELEQRLQQSARLEAVGRLAGGVAHDFNNVLTGITGYVDLALLELEPGSPVTEDLSRVRELVQRAAGVTRQLLAFSRRQPLRPIPLDLNRLVEGLITMLRPIIGDNIELVFVPDENLAQVSADPGQIEQMLVNLAVNARDAMPKGGELTIETANVVLDEQDTAGKTDLRPGPHVMLTVSDTGRGMDPETREHAFEPFFTTKDSGDGTGLGLAAVYGVVKQHEGDISVSTDTGQGTTFRIYLPCTPVDGRGPSDRPKELSLPRGDETILVVDDEDMIRVVVQRTLEAQGYRVVATTSPEHAAQLLSRHGDDVKLLLTDVIMPGTSGHELHERLAETQPSLKALYMSGYNDEAMLGAAFLDEGAPFIQKPFTAEALARKVREVLDGEAVNSAS